MVELSDVIMCVTSDDNQEESRRDDISQYNTIDKSKVIE
jgi:hypothetical protein